MRRVSRVGPLRFVNLKGIAPRIIAGGLLLLVGLILLSGCGESVPEPSGPPAPDFSVKTLDGSDFTLSEHRGKVIILYAMAAWCPTCVPEAQALARIHREYRGRGVEVLILDVWQGETEDQLAQFKNSVQGGDHFWAMDRENRWALAYEIRMLDTTVIIDRQGRIAYRDGYSTPYQKLREEVESLL
ncbi:MAG: peroxiredoxin family protein [Dehalococcoidia bacterium]